MIFFCGMHHPHNAHRVPRAFVSVNALRRRRSDFPVGEWVMDSGAFTTIAKHGGYPEPPETYADQIRRWARCGTLLAAVTQDYMCEPHMLARTGLTIAEHQSLTIQRYDALVSCDTGVYVMAVLQGYAPEDYASHVRQYGDRLAPDAWVGVGSVCKRNSDPRAIERVLRAIRSERPDLRLHGFGVKATSLASPYIYFALHSADSMAWSFAARRQGRDANDWREAVAFASRMALPPDQTMMEFMLS